MCLGVSPDGTVLGKGGYLRKTLALLLLLLAVGCGSSDSTMFGSASDTANTIDGTNAPLRAQGQPLTFKVTGDWGSGFGAEIEIANLSGAPLRDWTVEFDCSFTIDALWNARWSKTAAGYRLTPESWNATIPAGGSLKVGFNGHPGGPPAPPTNLRLNGQGSPTTPTPVPNPTPNPTPTSPPPSGSATVTSSITGDWGSGFGAKVAIKNSGTSALNDWTLQFDLRGRGEQPRIDSIWNVQILSLQGSTVTVGPLAWNQSIAAGQTVEFGFNGSPGGASISGAVLRSAGMEPEPSPSPSPQPTSSPTPSPSPSPTTPPPVGQSGPGLVAYFVEWGIYDRNYLVSDIPAGDINVINYAFAKIENGEVAVFDRWAAIDKAFPGDTWDQPLRGNFHQLNKLKTRHPHLKVLISVGGWTLSSPFSDVALTAASREKFARSAVDFITRYGFDGVDLDWEYPVGGGDGGNINRPADKQNYTLLLAELRRQLDLRGAQDGKRYLLTVAAPAGSDKMVNFQLARIAETVDWINLMTYDYHGAWENATNHHAPLHRNPQSPEAASLGYTADATVRAYLAAGVPASKLVLGIPAYGRSWSGVPVAPQPGADLAAAGLFRGATGPGPGSFEAGSLDYKDVVARLAQQPSVYQRLWDAAAQAPIMVASSLGVLVTYEDQQSLASKVAYAREQRLGGFMLWELSGDLKDRSRPESLVGTISRALRL
jgi:GH18 family chitinase